MHNQNYTYSQLNLTAIRAETERMRTKAETMRLRARMTRIKAKILLAQTLIMRVQCRYTCSDWSYVHRAKSEFDLR